MAQGFIKHLSEIPKSLWRSSTHRCCGSWGNSVSKMLCRSSDTVARGASPARGKCLHLSIFRVSRRGACASFPSTTGATRTTGVAQNHIDDDKVRVNRKRRENREFPLQRLQFQTRVDRWVLITALCVVEWNAQHNWLVCNNVGGVSSWAPNWACSLSKFHKFRLELEIVKIACLLEKISIHCSSAIRPDNHVCHRLSLSGFSRQAFL